MARHPQRRRLGRLFTELLGTLIVSGVGGFVPQPGQEFTIVTATGSLRVDFEAVINATTAPGLTFTPRVEGNRVILRVGGNSATTGVVFGDDFELSATFGWTRDTSWP